MFQCPKDCLGTFWEHVRSGALTVSEHETAYCRQGPNGEQYAETAMGTDNRSGYLSRCASVHSRDKRWASAIW